MLTPTTTILIGPYEFQIRAPYAAGHVLTEAEASAFNDWRGRGIIGNVRAWVVAAENTWAAKDGELLQDDVLARLQDQITEFDGRYSHPMERGSRNTKNPQQKHGLIERIAAEEAGKNLAMENRRTGRSQSVEDFTREAWEMAAKPEWRLRAREIIRIQHRVGGEEA